MRAGFGQGTDYSGIFSSLWNEDQSNRERLARDLDRRNDERQAAKDSEVFSKYEHGDITGAELLAYIRGRVSATASDPSEQAKWKDALRDYTESIADQNAEDAFAAGGSIHNLIAYYQDKQKGNAKGSPEYSQTQQRLYQLIDQAASDDLVMGAQRITEKIARGEASLQDLADFYKRQMRSLRPNSPLRTQVQGQLSSVETQIIQQNTASEAARIDFQFKAGQITGVEANNQLTALAATFQQSDPAQYWQMLEQGQSYLEQANQTAIPNLGALDPFGAPSGSPSAPSGSRPPRNWDGKWISNTEQVSGFKFITQLDGSEFAKKNCVFASGAMLAEAMGVSSLSGGDLRWLSGDTAGGSSWGYLRRAMGKVGLDVEVAKGLTFNNFIQKLSGGQPAVVGGNTARLPDSLRGEYLGGHAIYVDRYDPQKGFLVYNPAKRNTQGQWWSPEIMQAFAWGNRTNDSAVFAPKGAVANPGSRPVPSQISVWDKPKRNKPDKYGDPTPPSYGVGNDPGVDGRTQAALTRAGVTNRGSQTDADGNPRPYDLPLPTTQDEVALQRDRLQFQQDRAVGISDAFARGDTYYTEADGSKTPLTAQLVAAEQRAALGSLDYGMALSYAVNDPDAADNAADARSKLTAGILNAGDTRQEFLFNTIMADVGRRFAYSDTYDNDPGSAAGVVATQLARLKAFAANLDANDPSQPEGVSSPFKTYVQGVVDNLVTAADPNSDPAARQAALAALPDANTRNLGMGAMSTTDAAKGVADGTLLPALITPRDGNGRPQGPPEWSVVPARQDLNGKIVPATEGMVPVVIDGKVQWAEITDVPNDLRAIAVLDPARLAANLPKNLQTTAGKWDPGQIIPTSYLSGMTPALLAQLAAQGIISLGAPIPSRGIIIPAAGGGQPQTWVQDPETLLWYKDRLPTVAKPDSLGLGTVDIAADGTPNIIFSPGGAQGTYLPFAGDPKKAQALLDSGALAEFIPPVQFRDSFGVVSSDPAFAPDSRNMYDRTVPPINAYTGFNMDPNSRFIAPSPGARPTTTTPLQTGLGVDEAGIWSPVGSGVAKNLITSMRDLGITTPTLPTGREASIGFNVPSAPTAISGRRLPTVDGAPLVTLPKVPSTGFNTNTNSGYIAPSAKTSFTIPPPAKVPTQAGVSPYAGERGV